MLQKYHLSQKGSIYVAVNWFFILSPREWVSQQKSINLNNALAEIFQSLELNLERFEFVCIAETLVRLGLDSVLGREEDFVTEATDIWRNARKKASKKNNQIKMLSHSDFVIISKHSYNGTFYNRKMFR